MLFAMAVALTSNKRRRARNQTLNVPAIHHIFSLLFKFCCSPQGNRTPLLRGRKKTLLAENLFVLAARGGLCLDARGVKRKGRTASGSIFSAGTVVALAAKPSAATSRLTPFNFRRPVEHCRRQPVCTGNPARNYPNIAIKSACRSASRSLDGEALRFVSFNFPALASFSPGKPACKEPQIRNASRSILSNSRAFAPCCLYAVRVLQVASICVSS